MWQRSKQVWPARSSSPHDLAHKSYTREALSASPAWLRHTFAEFRVTKYSSLGPPFGRAAPNVHGACLHTCVRCSQVPVIPMCRFCPSQHGFVFEPCKTRCKSSDCPPWASLHCSVALFFSLDPGLAGVPKALSTSPLFPVRAESCRAKGLSPQNFFCG